MSVVEHIEKITPPSLNPEHLEKFSNADKMLDALIASGITKKRESKVGIISELDRARVANSFCKR